jgi:hypothetical protein
MRWLLGSRLFCVLAILVAQLTRISGERKSLTGVLTLAALLVVNVAGWPYHAQYNMYRTNTYSLIDAVQEATRDAESSPYSVFVSTDRYSSYLGWSTNNGHAFTQGDSYRISEVTFDPEDQTAWRLDCARLSAQTCLEVTVVSGSYVEQITTTTRVFELER